MQESEDNLLESSVCLTLAFVKLLPSSYRLPPLLEYCYVWMDRWYGYIATGNAYQTRSVFLPAAKRQVM